MNRRHRHQHKPKAKAKARVVPKLTEKEQCARRAQSERLLLHMRKREMVALQYDIPIEYKDRGKRFLRISVLAPRPPDEKKADDATDAHWNDVNNWKTFGHIVRTWLAKDLEVMVTRHNYFDPASPSNPESGGYQYKKTWLDTDRDAVIAWAADPPFESAKWACFMLFAAIARFPDQPISHALPPGTAEAYAQEQKAIASRLEQDKQQLAVADVDVDVGPCSDASTWRPTVQLGEKNSGTDIGSEGGKWHIQEQLLHRPAFNSDFGFNPLDQLVQSEDNPFYVETMRRHPHAILKRAPQVGTFEDVVRWWYRFPDRV